MVSFFSHIVYSMMFLRVLISLSLFILNEMFKLVFFNLLFFSEKFFKFVFPDHVLQNMYSKHVFTFLKKKKTKPFLAVFLLCIFLRKFVFEMVILERLILKLAERLLLFLGLNLLVLMCVFDVFDFFLSSNIFELVF